MSDWLHSLPVAWMALVVFGLTYLVAAAIYAVVTVLAVGEPVRAAVAKNPGHADDDRSDQDDEPKNNDHGAHRGVCTVDLQCNTQRRVRSTP